MRAILVGTVGEDRLYYILDAGPDDDDGAIEREDGGVVMFDFLSFASTARGLKKIRSSRFHRSLWDAPKNISTGAWNETFVKKTREIEERMFEGHPTYSSLGDKRKKINKVAKKTSDFKKSGTKNRILNKSHNDSMIKFTEPEYVFNSPSRRRDAWAAMCLLREIEEQQNEHK